jgi:putative oxidoreductase
MLFPSLAQYTDFAILIVRIMVAAIFISSGLADLKNPAARAASIGMDKPFTIFIGTAEVLGGLGVAAGVLTQLAALGLIIIMFGALYKKVFVWHTGFWGQGSSGWNYEMILLSMLTLILCTAGGRFVLANWPSTTPTLPTP